jgi:hypothetical protein
MAVCLNAGARRLVRSGVISSSVVVPFPLAFASFHMANEKLTDDEERATRARTATRTCPRSSSFGQASGWANSRLRGSFWRPCPIKLYTNCSVYLELTSHADIKTDRLNGYRI